MLCRPSLIARLSSAVLVSVLCFSASGLTLQDLRQQPNLTPAKFAAFFKDFEFTFRKEVQKPEVFLASRSGDCDDFSTLAADILRERGYTPRLIAVRMPGVTHVVFYVEETKSYLDYNNRDGSNRLMVCGNSLEAVAASVAQSYEKQWTSVSEFTFNGGKKCLVQTVAEPRNDPKLLAKVFNY